MRPMSKHLPLETGSGGCLSYQASACCSSSRVRVKRRALAALRRRHRHSLNTSGLTMSDIDVIASYGVLTGMNWRRNKRGSLNADKGSVRVVVHRRQDYAWWWVISGDDRDTLYANRGYETEAEAVTAVTKRLADMRDG